MKIIITVCVVLILLPVIAVLGRYIGMGTLSFGRTTVITTAPGEVIPEGTSFVKYGKMNSWFSPRGTIERLDYETQAYDNGVAYHKYVNVYLPAGYDAADSATKYNVIYYQHGNANSQETYNNFISLKWFDNLFASDNIEPAIVVFTSYYMDSERDAKEIAKTGSAEAGDGNWDGLPGNFWREVVEDILPAVESRYHTYAENDVSEEGLIATRDHRAFTGYSRGGVCTWYMFHNALPYFRWYVPMSCHTTAGKTIKDEVSPSEAFAYLKESIEAYGEMPFFIYATGGNAADAPKLREQMAFFVQQADVFSYGDNPENNNLFYALSDFRHADFYSPYSLYNALQILFH